MPTKTEILQHIAKLEQDIYTLRKMVLEWDDDPASKIADTSPAFTESTTPLLSDNSPEELISHFLIAAKQQNETDRDAHLTQLLHSSILKHPPAVDSFLRFSFKTLQNRWQDYLANPADASSFTITRQQRNDRGELSDLRIYLQATHRSPCPLTFQQDPLNDMQWRIISSSL